MTKRIVRDYFTAFRWSRIKETYAKEQWWLFLYLLIILPLICQFYDTKESTLAYWMVYIPFFFAMFAAPLHPPVLPKMLYLCPMSREMRREYIVKSCYIRVCIPIVIGIVGVAILLWQGICDWICGAGILLNLVLFATMMGSGVNAKGYGKKLENGQRVMNMDTAQGIYEAISLILAYLVSMLYAFLLATDANAMQWVKWVLIGATLLIQLPVTLKYLSYWQESVENSIYYEGK